MIIHDARILTLAGPTPRRGAGLRDLRAIPRGHVVIEGDRIVAVGEGPAPPGHGERIDARGRVLLPGFVDAHSHACWAGDRLDEWDERRAGASYLDVLSRGGGILSTVSAVRAASEEDLAALLSERLKVLAAEGTTSVEVKSGYGLSPSDELKMLRAIRRAAEKAPITVIPTALLGHAIDPAHPGGRAGFIDETIDVTLALVSAEWPGIAIDAYCESGAWSVAECERLFDRAAALGHPIRIHADQFTELGAVAAAIARGARSVDHLEATSPDSMRRLAASGTFGVALPGGAFHGGGPVFDARGFVDAGGALVLATNFNPGTSPCASIPFIVALGVRHLGLTPAEAIASVTANAAALLGLADRGRIEPGLRADLVLLRHRDERELAFEFGGRAADLVISGGRIVA
jgi:imidazolonepropionase